MPDYKEILESRVFLVANKDVDRIARKEWDNIKPTDTVMFAESDGKSYRVYAEYADRDCRPYTARLLYGAADLIDAQAAKDAKIVQLERQYKEAMALANDAVKVGREIADQRDALQDELNDLQKEDRYDDGFGDALRTLKDIINVGLVGTSDEDQDDEDEFPEDEDELDAEELTTDAGAIEGDDYSCPVCGREDCDGGGNYEYDFEF